MQKGKGDPPVESRGSEWTPLLSKLHLRSLDVAGSKLSLRLGQQFTPNRRDTEGKENLPLNYYANLLGNE